MSRDDHHLANKYRPTRFGEVIGQEAAVGAIRGALIRGKLRPGLLLHGPHSTGKTTIARLYALYLNCAKPDPKTYEPCGECTSCKLMRSVIAGRSVHPDVTEMNAALHGGIDKIRQLEVLASNAPRYRNRVFIMDEAHQITAAAFNGALKLLEDAPARTKFVFCTTNPEKLPDAIWSRCQWFKLEPLSTMQVAKRLFSVAQLEGFKPSKPVLQKLCMNIGSATHGHLRDAFGLLDNVINYAQSKETDGEDDLDSVITEISHTVPELGSYEAARKYMSAMFSGNVADALHAIAETNNIEYFVKNVIECFQLIFYHWVDDSLVDRNRLSMIKGVPFPSGKFGAAIVEKNPEQLANVLSGYVAALEKAKLYSTDTIALLQVVTFNTITQIRKWSDA